MAYDVVERGTEPKVKRSVDCAACNEQMETGTNYISVKHGNGLTRICEPCITKMYDDFY